MAYNYPPLDFLREGENLGFTEEENFNMVKENIGGLPKDITEKELIKFVLSEQFMNNLKSDNKFFDFNQNVLYQMPMYLQRMGIELKQLRSGQVDPCSEMRDIIIAHSLIGEWAKYKQIYKPDPDFATALINTDKAKITKENISHLPINNFYLDISDMHYKEIHGTFVHIIKDGDFVHLVLYALTHDCILFSSYLTFKFSDEKPEIIVSQGDIRKNEPWIIPSLNTDVDKYKFSFKPIVTLVLQLIIYMGVPEKDVSESPKTKTTYRPRKPGAPIKNKYSEMQMFDVGIKYGSEFRRRVKELNIDKDKIVTMSESDEKRKSPQPHLRSAHWSHYWCGPKVNQHLELRWIEPCFVGFGENSILNQATIHKINGE